MSIEAGQSQQRELITSIELEQIIQVAAAGKCLLHSCKIAMVTENPLLCCNEAGILAAPFQPLTSQLLVDASVEAQEGQWEYDMHNGIRVCMKRNVANPMCLNCSSNSKKHALKEEIGINCDC